MRPHQSFSSASSLERVDVVSHQLLHHDKVFWVGATVVFLLCRLRCCDGILAPHGIVAHGTVLIKSIDNGLNTSSHHHRCSKKSILDSTASCTATLLTSTQNLHPRLYAKPKQNLSHTLILSHI
uniref:Uncharacterized protein n=1 Tax=Cyclophora tenuis TaxID=216820 RepID=A0A7S1GJI1_CYCTE